MPIKNLLEVACFNCHEKIFIKYIQRTKSYSQKNDWDYWTDTVKKTKKEKEYICDECLLDLYFRYKKEFREFIKSLKKRKLLQTYISNGIIGELLPFPRPE